MNSKLIFLILFLNLLYGIASAQDSVKTKPINPHGVTILNKFNPLPILWGPIPLTAEYRYVRETVIAAKQSLMVGISYLGKSPIYAMIEDSINKNSRNPIPKM